MTRQDPRMHAVRFVSLLAASSLGASLPAAAAAAGSPTAVAPVTSTATPGPGASSAPSRAAERPDRAANLVGGVWQCETVAGSTGTHTYTSDEDDGSIELRTELHAGFRTFRITETYRFDDAKGKWTVATDGGAYAGMASPWLGYKWIFDGTENLHGRKHPVRMVYFDLGDQAFRRDFQALQDGSWRTYSAETCRRPST